MSGLLGPCIPALLLLFASVHGGSVDNNSTGWTMDCVPTNTSSSSPDSDRWECEFPIFMDAPTEGWTFWSPSDSDSLATFLLNCTFAREGVHSIVVAMSGKSWQAWSIIPEGFRFQPEEFDYLEFYIYASQLNYRYDRLTIYASNGTQPYTRTPHHFLKEYVENETIDKKWRRALVPISELVPNGGDILGITIQLYSHQIPDGPVPPFYIDSLRLLRQNKVYNINTELLYDDDDHMKEKEGHSVGFIASSISALLIAIFLILGLTVGLAFWKRKRGTKLKRDKKTQEEDGIPSLQKGYTTLSITSQENNQKPKLIPGHNEFLSWEIKPTELQVGRVIGEGAYGTVSKGTWRKVEVAVKKLKNGMLNEQKEEFFREAKLISSLRPHANLVTFYGVCLQPLCLVTEYMPKGSLEAFLLSPVTIGRKNSLCIMEGVAAGLAHLHSEGVVHRDIAARNVLLQETAHGGVIAKLTDFGLSRFVSADTVGKTQADVGPVKWMAPESLVEKVYSPASDMWAYAVVMYECINRAKPFADMDAFTVGTHVVYKGLHVPLPDPLEWPICHDIMRGCFSFDSSNRPTADFVLMMLPRELIH